MQLQIDQYAHLDSPLHRWNPRIKFISLFLLIIAFSLVQNLQWVPLMLAITVGLFALSKLPVGFLVGRLRYPGIFLLALIVILPFFAGQTVIWELGPLALREEGIEYMLLVVSRFTSILTITVIIFGTSSFLTNVQTLRSLGLPSILVDILMLTVRYIFEIGDTLMRMQRAMRLRGFAPTRFNLNSAIQWASLIGSLLIRSYEQSQRVYKAMRLRGYGDSTASSEDNTMQQASSTIALQLEDLRFAYLDQMPTLDGVSLTIGDGEKVGLIGPNGAGKTSLFLTTCGVLKPDSGQIRLYGQDVQPSKFYPEIGLIFQNSDDQLFSPTVEEDIAFGPGNMGLSEEEVSQRVNEALSLTNTHHLSDRAPHHLSGGEKRMVAIASVLAMRPQLVLYDEPDANLDMRSRRRLIQFLQNAQHTIIVASHDLEMILEVCDRVILLDNGRIIADDEPHTLLANTTLMEAHGLEKPHSLVPHRHLDGTPSH